MSILVVGMSHRSAPVIVLERAAVAGDELSKLLHDVFEAEHVAGTFVVSTCNRVEVYAEVDKFHAGVAAICELLARHAGIAHGDLTPHLYVHYEDRAVQHLLSMTCGLESMVVARPRSSARCASRWRWLAGRESSAAYSTTSAPWRCARPNGPTRRPA